MRDWLTTSECARCLGVTPRYIRAEILDGRLQAVVITRAPARNRTRGNRCYRIYRAEWAVYLEHYWPREAAQAG